MYAYTSCRPDIGYAVTVLSKFTTCPSKIHYQYLRRVALYLKHTKTWGIMFHRESPSNHTDLQANDEEVDIISLPTNFLSFPDYPKGTNHDCYVDAVYANDPRPPNDLRKRRSTTGFANSLAGGAVVYRSKTQTVTVLLWLLLRQNVLLLLLLPNTSFTFDLSCKNSDFHLQVQTRSTKTLKLVSRSFMLDSPPSVLATSTFHFFASKTGKIAVTSKCFISQALLILLMISQNLSDGS